MVSKSLDKGLPRIPKISTPPYLAWRVHLQSLFFRHFASASVQCLVVVCSIGVSLRRGQCFPPEIQGFYRIACDVIERELWLLYVSSSHCKTKMGDVLQHVQNLDANPGTSPAPSAGTLKPPSSPMTELKPVPDLYQIIIWPWTGSIFNGFWWIRCRWKALGLSFSTAPKSVKYRPRSGSYYDLVKVG